MLKYPEVTGRIVEAALKVHTAIANLFSSAYAVSSVLQGFFQPSHREGREFGVGAADDNAYTFAGIRLICAGEESREGGGAAGFGDDAQFAPESPLRFDDLFVGHKRNALNEPLRDGKHEFADAARAKRIGGNA